MKKKFLYSLQAFAEAVQGKRIVYLFRIASEASTTAVSYTHLTLPTNSLV